MDLCSKCRNRRVKAEAPLGDTYKVTTMLLCSTRHLLGCGWLATDAGQGDDHQRKPHKQLPAARDG